MKERVQKILSQWGMASRRSAEQMILEGRVKINSRVVKLGDQADLSSDRLEVDGQILSPQNRPKLCYILLNKPLGVVSSCNDPQGRPTVLDLLSPSLRQGQGLHPVGRLDINSSGALLLTNDGELTLTLTHPRYHLPKTYEVCLEGYLSEGILQQWGKGVTLEGKKTLPAKIRILKADQNQTWIEIILIEGRNRQIRRVAAQLGLKVLKLHRTAIADLKLQSSKGNPLPRGEYRLLCPSEIEALKQAAIPSKLKVVVSE